MFRGALSFMLTATLHLARTPNQRRCRHWQATSMVSCAICEQCTLPWRASGASCTACSRWGRATSHWAKITTTSSSGRSGVRAHMGSSRLGSMTWTATMMTTEMSSCTWVRSGSGEVMVRGCASLFAEIRASSTTRRTAKSWTSSSQRDARRLRPRARRAPPAREPCRRRSRPSLSCGTWRVRRHASDSCSRLRRCRASGRTTARLRCSVRIPEHGCASRWRAWHSKTRC
mmetsp:Transcript_44762/g.95229  ORF Transcript_44762/g.95229 Transcript_44762/m.95229 type:complete len:230 (+) Transcript_44762:386-1075(+)